MSQNHACQICDCQKRDYQESSCRFKQSSDIMATMPSLRQTFAVLCRLCPAAFRASVGIILYLSLVPGTLRPHSGVSGHLEHFMAYAGTGAFYALSGRRRLSLLGAAIGLSRLSGAVEIAQLWIPGRTGEIAGFLWSSAGAGLGLLVGLGLWRSLNR